MKLRRENWQWKGSSVVIDVYILLNHPVKQGSCGMICLTKEPRRQVNLNRDDLSIPQRALINLFDVLKTKNGKK